MDYAGGTFPALTDNDTLYTVKDYSVIVRDRLNIPGMTVLAPNNYRLHAQPASDYPAGISLFYANADAGFPFNYCTVKTEKQHATGGGAYQSITDNINGGRKHRTFKSSTNSWTAWKDVYVP